MVRMPRSRAIGCLLWLVVLILVLIVLSIVFGSFQKGTRVNGASLTVATACRAGIARPPVTGMLFSSRTRR
jgi:hypothetical protein